MSERINVAGTINLLLGCNYFFVDEHKRVYEVILNKEAMNGNLSGYLRHMSPESKRVFNLKLIKSTAEGVLYLDIVDSNTEIKFLSVFKVHKPASTHKINELAKESLKEDVTSFLVDYGSRVYSLKADMLRYRETLTNKIKEQIDLKCHKQNEVNKLATSIQGLTKELNAVEEVYHNTFGMTLY